MIGDLVDYSIRPKRKQNSGAVASLNVNGGNTGWLYIRTRGIDGVRGGAMTGQDRDFRSGIVTANSSFYLGSHLALQHVPSIGLIAIQGMGFLQVTQIVLGRCQVFQGLWRIG